MPNYTEIFNARGNLYNRASEICPDARNHERKLLVDLLSPQTEELILDAPAGGGYLADGLAEAGSCRTVCIEPSKAFARGIGERFATVICPISKTPFRDESLDKVGSLAGLHHMEDKQAFFNEAFRVLKPGGILAVADVMEQTPAAHFLNGFVDRYTRTGHKGIFFKSGEMQDILETAGFSECHETLSNLTWDYPNESVMVEYCWNLFGLVKAKANQLHEELKNTFSITTSDKTRMGWSLVYGVGIKPA